MPPVKDGLNGIDGAAGLSAYQLWLGADNGGTIADFLHSIVGAQGPKGDKGAMGATGTQGPKGDKGDPGTLNATATLACIVGTGSNAHLGLGYAACHCDANAITVYVPTS